MYILLGVIAEVYPEYMTPYAERLNGLYLGAIKAEVWLNIQLIVYACLS